MTHRLLRPAAVAAAAALLAGCTMKKQEAPPLAGPSELGTSITLTATPDVIFHDGASQSLVTITARDANGVPMRNLTLRAEIAVNGAVLDFGSLSARNVVTGSDGRATLVYTAPPGPGRFATESGTTIDVLATPIGSDFANALPRAVTIRLVPTGIVIPPDGLQPRFVFSPEAPSEGQSIRFEACPPTAAACAPANNPVASYSWDFGDGTTATGRIVNKSFLVQGTYVVTLTIADGFGRTAATTQTIAVGAGVAPTAAFVVIPVSPFVGQIATFDASSSRPSPGRTIRSYSWDFGDGDVKIGLTSPTTTHDFMTAGSFTVILTVTDDLGRISQATQSVTVRADSPVADFTFSPPNPVVGTNITFTSTSTAPPGRTIVSYFWNFGDGTTSTAPNPTKSYGTAAGYDVTLGVTDSAGRTSTVTKRVVVQ